MEDEAHKFRKENEPPDRELTSTPLVPDPSLNPAPRLNNEQEKKKSLENTITHYSTSGQGPSFEPKSMLDQIAIQMARQARNNADKTAPKNTIRKRQHSSSGDDYESDRSASRESKSKRSKKTKANNQRRPTQTKRRDHNSDDDYESDRSASRESKSKPSKKTKANNQRRPTQTKRRDHNSDDDYESDRSASRESKSKPSKKTKANNQRITAQDKIFEYYKKRQLAERNTDLEMISRPSFHKVPVEKKSIRNLDSQASSFASFNSSDEPII